MVNIIIMFLVMLHMMDIPVRPGHGFRELQFATGKWSVQNRKGDPLNRITLSMIPMVMVVSMDICLETREPSVPRAPLFDSISMWKPFFTKLNNFAIEASWSYFEPKRRLCWLMEGKASDIKAHVIQPTDREVCLAV